MCPLSSRFPVNNNPAPGRCRDQFPKALFKRDAADFQVVENLGFEPDGAGEHLWIQVRKRNCNTQDVIDALSRQLKVPAKNIGYSGLKDKRAITTQWLSVVYPIAEGNPDSSGLLEALDGVEVLLITRGSKKLRRGAHRENAFTIRLYQIEHSQSDIDDRLDAISNHGFANYFGAQRFGIGGRNVELARQMFSSGRKTSRTKRSLYLSAARAYLFNKVLDARIAAGTTQQVLSGDVCMLNGTNSIFACETPDAEIQRRYEQLDLHITGPLYGRGQSKVEGAVLELESACLASESLLCEGLEQAGLKNERRALRALAGDLQWHWADAGTLELSFSLQRGVYATALLDEIVQLQQEHKK